MKNGYKTISSIKNECVTFATSVLARNHSMLDDAALKSAFLSTNEPVEIAAIVSEVIFRKKGLKLFACQIETAYALYKGHIAELPTGEGKTLAAVVAAALYVKAERSVQILVFNDYLANRDALDNKEIFDFLDISTSFIVEGTSIKERLTAYNADVLYISAREAGYDSIRNFVAFSSDELLGGKYDVAIVDEADSILIDEASIPLVLAGKAENRAADELKIIDAVYRLESEDFEIDEQNNQIWLNDNGIKKIENLFEIDNLYDNQNVSLLSGVNTALQAVHMLKKDTDYIVRDGKIAVIDEATGRIAANRKFPNTLHRFIEAKEGITDNINTQIFCSMTIGAFMEQYKTICGMTGTAATSANELETTYELRTVVMEPHTPCIRNDHKDIVFLTDKERDEAVLTEIVEANKVGQPVLIGTASVMESEKLSAKLSELGIKHQVLNAKNDQKEAEIIADAGKPYSVTVSTNMAGRGVDIKLGGKDEADKQFVAELGGLYVISTTINRSRRIDNQLKGRAGRQGDPGESRFFISLEDETISPFFEQEEGVKPLTEKEKFAMVRTAQQTLEGNEAEARYTLKKYSYIIERQRRVMSKYRLQLLNGEKTPEILRKNDFDGYLELQKQVGDDEINRAETLLLLHYINQHFSNYLEAMEEVKSGIHLTIVGGKNPFDEFNRAAIDSFEEMNQDICFDVLNKMQNCTVVDGKIDLENFNLSKSTGTWTYMVDDSTGQFNHLPALMNMVSKKIKKSLSLGDRLDNFLNRFKNK